MLGSDEVSISELGGVGSLHTGENGNVIGAKRERGLWRLRGGWRYGRERQEAKVEENGRVEGATGRKRGWKE